MSTLVSLLLAAVLNFLGSEIPSEVKTSLHSEISQTEHYICFEAAEIIEATCIQKKNESLFILEKPEELNC